jgi:O-antigen ligase
MVLAILSPDVTILPALPQFRLEEWYIYTLVPFIFLTRRRALNHSAVPVLAYFAVSAAVLLLSVAHSVIILRAEFILRDLTDAAQMVKYCGLAWLVGTVDWDEEQLRRLALVVALGFAASALWGIQQRWDVFGVNSQMASVYTSGVDRAAGVESKGRVFGTSGHPNEFGALMTMGAAFGLSMLTPAGTARAAPLALVGLCSTALVMSGSRGAIVAFVAAVAAAAGLLVLRARGPRSLATVALALLVIGAVFVYTPRYVPYLDDLGEVLRDPSADASFTNRWSIGAQRALALWYESPLLGWGPAKAEITTLYDSQYYYTLSRGGLVGMALLGVFILWPPRCAARLVGATHRPAAMMLGSWLILGSIASSIINVSNLTFSKFQFMDLWVPVVTIGLVLYRGIGAEPSAVRHV